MNTALQHLQLQFDGQAQAGYREPRPPHTNDQHLDPALTAGNHDSPHPDHNQAGLEALQQSTEAITPSQHDDTQQHEQQQNDTSTQPQDPSTPGQTTDQTALQDLGQPIPATFPNLEDLITHLQTFARDHGFALVRSTLRRRESDKAPILLNLLCDRHGHLRNHRKLTEETRVRKKRKSRGIGCPYRVSCTLRQVKNEVDKVDEGGQQRRAPVAVMQSQAATDGGSMEGVETVNDPAIDPSLQDTATPQSAQQQQQQQEEQQSLPSMPAPPTPNNINPLASSAPQPTSTEVWTFKVTSPSHNHSSTTALSTPGTTTSTTATPATSTSKTTTTISPTDNPDTPTTPSNSANTTTTKTPKSTAPAPETHWKHRRITPTDMKRIRQWFIDGKSPREMFDLIKADSPGCLYTLKDLQNARRRAKVQFEEFLEGKGGAGVGVGAGAGGA